MTTKAKTLERALNALRLEVHGDIVDSVTTIVYDAINEAVENERKCCAELVWEAAHAANGPPEVQEAARDVEAAILDWKTND